MIRSGAGFYYDQPVTNIVTPLGSNPPFSQSVNITQNINLAAPFAGNRSTMGRAGRFPIRPPDYS